MGTIIHVDFKKQAAARDLARQAQETPDNDLSALPAPHQWPAGGDDDPAADIATVMTLDGAFRDSALFAAIPRAHDGYSLLQFAPHVTPETMGNEKPVARMYIHAEELERSFDPLHRASTAKLGQYFARMALLSGNPGQEAQLYTLGVKGVHIVVDGGLYAFGNGKIAERYSAGDVVVEYKGDSVAYGPAAMMLPRLTPLDDDARIALAHAPSHIPGAARPSGPDGFNF